MVSQDKDYTVPLPKKDSRTLAKEARDWVASQEGQQKIDEALTEARKVTSEHNKSQQIGVERFRVPFRLHLEK